MKLARLILLFPFAFASTPAVAQDKIVAPTPGSSATLDLYDAPDAARLSRQIKVGDAGLPLTVQAKEAGFYKVDIGGQSYWMRSAKVRVSRGSTANCGALAMGSSGPTASTPGAGKDACK